MKRLKVGEVSKIAGITVRTLHHYDHMGLLSPSFRKEGGNRLYSPEDLSKLHKILTLRRFGYSLGDIAALLESNSLTRVEIIDRQIAALDEQARRSAALRNRLLRLKEAGYGESPVGASDWLEILDLMRLYDNYFTLEEIEGFAARNVRDGGTIRRRWSRLLKNVRAAQLAGVDPKSSEAGAMIAELAGLVKATTGEDIGLEHRLRRMFALEKRLREVLGLDRETAEWLRAASEFVKEGGTSKEGTTMTNVVGDQEKPKKSALRVAGLRALHQLIDSPVVFHDPLALKILGTVETERLKKAQAGDLDPLTRGLVTSLAVRAAFAELELKSAAARGMGQFVILGAGLDTWAYQERNTSGATVFEVDLPATHGWKREMLRQAKIPEPKNVVYVPIDFEKGNLAEALGESGFDSRSQAVFTMLGVTMYLDEKSVVDVFSMVGSMPKDSGIIFDYWVDPALLGERERRGAEYISGKLAERGEPWKTSFDPAKLGQLLSGAGFANVEDLDAAAINQRFLDGRNDGLRKSAITRLVSAYV